MKKWGNIRDAFIKSCKKIKECKKSGSGASSVKKYVYNDQLQFLSKVIQERHTEDSFSDNTQIETTNSTESSADFKVNKEVGSRKRRKNDDVELKILRILESSNQPSQPNRHMSFFNGIIPSLETFDDDDIIQFQIGVLQLIENVKRKKRQQSFYQSPAPGIAHVRTSVPYHMAYLSEGEPRYSNTEMSGSSRMQFPTVNQFYPNFGQEQSALPSSGQSHSEIRPTSHLSSSSNTESIDFASL